MAERELNLDSKEYPANSHKSKKDATEKNIEKVVEGNVKTKQKPLGKRLSGSIFDGDDFHDVLSYIFSDVLIPALKETLWNIISGGSERLIFGETTKSRKDSKRYTAYDKASYRNEGHRTTSRRHSINDYQDVIFEGRGDAEEVLDNLYDLVIDYGSASVADFYDLAGITGSFTDNKYGWVNLDGVSIKMVRGGYILDLPRPELLD